MTYRRYNISRGNQVRGPAAIAEATITTPPLTSGSVQVTIDFAGPNPIGSKREAAAAINMIADRIERGPWPPG
ncbi:MAG: hypothetical protein ACK50Q_16205 [Labrys sp. (in: a-proteobacteria)]